MRTRLPAAALAAAGALLFAEGAARLAAVPLFGLPPGPLPEALYARRYPELGVARQACLRDGGAEKKILLLGGSVLEGDGGRHSRIPEELLRALRARGVAARVFNLAKAAHSSRDAALKHRQMEPCRFDLIIYYEALNEARANNVPDAFFDRGYRHYAWYRQLGIIERHPELPWAVLPYLIDRALSGAVRPPAPAHAPREKGWLGFGSRIKTAPSFEHNLAELARRAGERGEPLLLATYALHLPRGYSPEKFARRQLDYSFDGENSHPASIWGLPENIAKAVRVHNEILRRIASDGARARPGRVELADAAAVLPRTGAHFKDPCHLTPRGSRAFVAALLPAALRLLGAAEIGYNPADGKATRQGRGRN